MVLGVLLVSSANTKTAEAHSSTNASLVVNEARRSEPQTSVSEVPVGIAVAVPDTLHEPVATSIAVMSPVEIITPPPADLNLEDPKLRRMQPHEISRGMLEVAAKIVRKYYAKPVGTQIEVEVDGKE